LLISEIYNLLQARCMKNLLKREKQKESIKPLSSHVITRGNRRRIAAADIERLHANDAILCPFQHLNRHVAIDR
jgi:hypothetical protein